MSAAPAALRTGVAALARAQALACAQALARARTVALP